METEQTQEGVVEEQVKEEISTPVSETASTEEKATSEKQKDDEWKRMMQSKADKAEFALKSAQGQLQELRKYNEQRELEAQRKELEAVADEPELLKIVKERQRLDAKKREFDAYIRETQGDVDRQYKDAIRLSEQYGVKISELFGVAKSTEQMELLAENLALKAEQAKGQDKVQKEKGFRPDSNTSDAAPSDFKQLEKNFIEDPYKYGKQYREALLKRGQ